MKKILELCLKNDIEMNAIQYDRFSVKGVQLRFTKRSVNYHYQITLSAEEILNARDDFEDMVIDLVCFNFGLLIPDRTPVQPIPKQNKIDFSTSMNYPSNYDIYRRRVNQVIDRCDITQTIDPLSNSIEYRIKNNGSPITEEEKALIVDVLKKQGFWGDVKFIIEKSKEDLNK